MVNLKLIWKVDTFIEKLNRGEYKISPDAYKIYYDYNGNKKTLGAMLYEAIDTYEKYSIFAGISGDFEAQSLSSWINTAFAQGVILDNSDLLNKLREKEELNSKLGKAAKYWKETAQKFGTDLEPIPKLSFCR